jgi:hypothetical protein
MNILRPLKSWVRTNQSLYKATGHSSGTKGIKHRKPDFKLIDGTVNYLGNLEVIIDAIIKVVE